jgi:hypothetical protein
MPPSTGCAGAGACQLLVLLQCGVALGDGDVALIGERELFRRDLLDVRRRLDEFLLEKQRIGRQIIEANHAQLATKNHRESPGQSGLLSSAHRSIHNAWSHLCPVQAVEKDRHLRRITPSWIAGQMKWPVSSRFEYKTKPVPSQARILTRSLRFERNTNKSPQNGSLRNVSVTASPTSPFRAGSRPGLWSPICEDPSGPISSRGPRCKEYLPQIQAIDQWLDTNANIAQLDLNLAGRSVQEPLACRRPPPWVRMPGRLAPCSRHFSWFLPPAAATKIEDWG